MRNEPALNVLEFSPAEPASTVVDGGEPLRRGVDLEEIP
jgi:hypothetical protein